MVLLALLGFLIFVSSLFLIIRAFTLITNEEIGLYEEDHDSFEDYTVYNYVIEILNIVFNCINIGFIFTIKLRINKKPPKIAQQKISIVIQQSVIQSDENNPVN
jgi:hypothetical protein